MPIFLETVISVETIKIMILTHDSLTGLTKKTIADLQGPRFALDIGEDLQTLFFCVEGIKLLVGTIQ